MTRFTLATLRTARGAKAAIGVGERYFELAEVSRDFQHHTVKSMLDDWTSNFPKLEMLVSDIGQRSHSELQSISAEEGDLLTPIVWPNKVVCVGANYADHLREMGLKAERWEPMPFFMCPPSTCLVGPGETVKIPKSTKQFDWELELAVIVGKRLENVTKEEAADAIAAYSIGFDLSCRDLIKVDNELRVDLVRGKSQDTMKPVGPFIVPAKFLPDVSDLKLTLSVNGKQMMDSSTKEMLFTCDEMLSTISSFVTLEPGDIVFTGSPNGSAGVHGNCWLKPGDSIHAEIEGIGAFDVQMQRS